jgi:hypothetical protein
MTTTYLVATNHHDVLRGNQSPRSLQTKPFELKAYPHNACHSERSEASQRQDASLRSE